MASFGLPASGKAAAAAAGAQEPHAAGAGAQEPQAAGAQDPQRAGAGAQHFGAGAQHEGAGAQQDGAGAAHTGAGAGAQQVGAGAGAQQDGAAVQQLLCLTLRIFTFFVEQQELHPPQLETTTGAAHPPQPLLRENRPASAELTAANNAKAAATKPRTIVISLVQHHSLIPKFP